MFAVGSRETKGDTTTSSTTRGDSKQNSSSSKLESRSKSRMAKLGWKSKWKKALASSQAPTSRNSSHLQSDNDNLEPAPVLQTKAPPRGEPVSRRTLPNLVEKMKAKKTQATPPAVTTSLSSASWSAVDQQQQQHQKGCQNESSPSCDLSSSGYLSQTNGIASSLKAQVESSDTNNNNDSDMLYITQSVNSNNNNSHQHNQPARLGGGGAVGGLYYSNSLASSTRLPMVPMMIDDEEQQLELELGTEREDDDDGDDDDDENDVGEEQDENNYDDDDDFDFERHHQSYQLMIDGLKRRQLQQQQHRQRLQHQQGLVQHRRCQQDDKLSLMMLHNNATANDDYDGDDSNHHQHHHHLHHLGLYTGNECADSESMSSDHHHRHHQLQLQHYHRHNTTDDHHQHRHHLSTLPHALAPSKQQNLTGNTYNPPQHLLGHLRDSGSRIDRLDGPPPPRHHRVLAPASLNYHENDDQFGEPTNCSKFNQATELLQRPTITVYHQPDVINSEHYSRLTNNNNHHLQQQQQQHRQRRQRGSSSSSSFLQHEQQQQSRQVSRSSTTINNKHQNQKHSNTQNPLKFTSTKAAPPPPPARDQQQSIRGRVQQAGQLEPANLAAPIVSDKLLRLQQHQHQDEVRTSGHHQTAVANNNKPVSRQQKQQFSLTHHHHRAQRTMITTNSQSSGTGSRQHLTSPDFSTPSHHIKRAKSNSQLQSLGTIGSGINHDQQLQHPIAARPVPKSASALINSAVSSGSGGGGMTQSASQMSANLHAISNNGGAHESEAMGCCGKLAKFLLFIANVLFWCAGIALGAWGILALVEDHKYNLSQLLVFEANSRMSLFQLLAWSFITLGGATILIGVCGCSAMFKNSRWILGLYIFLILAIFALDLATGLLAIIFQERLVANVRLRLVSKLRNEYGIQASFTAAIDYIQTRFECCGLEGHFDYEQSLWRLQRLGGFEATVARTCCHLRNTHDDQAHVNPRPVNESMCQSTDVRFHQSYRFRRGCLDDLERLIRHKIWTFTIGCGIVGAIILMVLALATCFCRSIPDSGQNNNSNNKNKNSSSSNNSTSRKSSSNRVQQQALMYAEAVAKKQNNHQYHHHGGHHGHHGHHTSSSAHHK